MCSHCWAPVDASGVWEFSFYWEIKRKFGKFKTTTQIKAQPQGVVADGKYEFSEKASEHLE